MNRADKIKECRPHIASKELKNTNDENVNYEKSHMPDFRNLHVGLVNGGKFK